jgi:hypothetical protein
MTSDNGTGRRRGSIRQRGGSLQVRVFAGQDPVTQRERYLSETSRTGLRLDLARVPAVALVIEVDGHHPCWLG